jgi:hypothetical protein
MISSPCKICSQKDQDKDTCYKVCGRLQSLQNMQLLLKEIPSAPGIDCSEESRFDISYQ